MGALAALVLSIGVFYATYAFLRYRSQRAQYWASVKRDPLRELLVFVAVASIMLFFWGLIIPPLGTIRFALGRKIVVQLWQIAGVVAFVAIILADLPRFRK